MKEGEKRERGGRERGEREREREREVRKWKRNILVTFFVVVFRNLLFLTFFIGGVTANKLNCAVLNRAC